MGNRAVIAFESMPEMGVYLHWNGGPESIAAFLAECKEKGYRSPGGDETYAMAGLIKAIQDLTNYDGLSLGVGPIDRLDTDNGDNGVYWLGNGWEVSRRSAR